MSRGAQVRNAAFIMILLGLAFNGKANANQLLQISPFYHSGSIAVSYAYGLSRKTALDLGYDHLSGANTGNPNNYVNLYSLSFKWSPFTEVNRGLYFKAGAAKIDTNVFSSIPVFGTIFAKLANRYIPYALAGWDFRVGHSWRISLEAGTDIRFLNVGYVF